MRFFRWVSFVHGSISTVTYADDAEDDVELFETEELLLLIKLRSS